jgi:hypothetical protein
VRWSIHATVAVSAGAVVLTMILCTRKLIEAMPNIYSNPITLQLDQIRTAVQAAARNTASIDDRLKTPDERFQDTVKMLENAKAIEEAEDRAKRGEPFRP